MMSEHEHAPDKVAAPPAAPTASPLSDAVTMPVGDPDFMLSLARGLAVIRAFATSEGRLTMAQLSRLTGISRAAVRRCLYTLGRLGYVREIQGRFVLLPAVMALGHLHLAARFLPSLAQPVLDQVRATLQETCSLGVLDGDEVLHVARALAGNITAVDLPVGSRLPVYCSSMGRVLLADLSRPVLDAYLARVERHALTPFTRTAREPLLDELEAVQRQGWALVDQELELGLRSLSVPVYGFSGRVVAALNVSVEASRASAREAEVRLLPTLLAASRELGRQLID